MIDFAADPVTDEAATSADSTLGFDPSQIEEHRRDEEIIGRNRRSFEDVGGALFRIRERRSYRLTHPTFDNYCLERWGLARNRAYQLIDSYIVIRNIQNFGQKLPILPENEAQTYPLTPLPPEQQCEIWRRAVETAPNGRVTAAHVAATLREYRGECDPEPESEGPKEWTLCQAQEYLGSRIFSIYRRWPPGHIVVMAYQLQSIADELLARGELCE